MAEPFCYKWFWVEQSTRTHLNSLDNIKTEVTKNSNDIKKLKADHKGLSTQLAKSNQSVQTTSCKLEASIVELEDRSRRDNVRIINLPEKAEKDDASGYVSSSLSKWFPTFAGVKIEVMRAHRIGPERNTGSRTLICKTGTASWKRTEALGSRSTAGKSASPLTTATTPSDDAAHFPKRWRQRGKLVFFRSWSARPSLSCLADQKCTSSRPRQRRRISSKLRPRHRSKKETKRLSYNTGSLDV